MYDNARTTQAHSAATLNPGEWRRLISHPPHSPDVAPVTLIFRKAKISLQGRKISQIEDITFSACFCVTL
jgi:hypothetical protein